MTTREQPDMSVKRYVMWYSLRRNGLPEDEILRDLEHRGLGEFGSPRTLYQQLANDKFPVCEVCGETPEEPDHCEKLGGPEDGLRLIRKHWSSYRPPTPLGTYSWTPSKG